MSNTNQLAPKKSQPTKERHTCRGRGRVRGSAGRSVSLGVIRWQLLFLHLGFAQDADRGQWR
jgi:hypothetical protein